MTSTRYFIARFAQAFGYFRRSQRLGDAASEMHLLREAEAHLGAAVWENVEGIEALSVEYWNLRKLVKERDLIRDKLATCQTQLEQAHADRAQLLNSTPECHPDRFDQRAAVLADLDEFLLLFRSCNRSFHQDPDRRLDTWCGVCDKCLFIDLVLAPFVPPEVLAHIFNGAEPLTQPALAGQLRVLVGLSDETRPFECVGDEEECREALLRTIERPDRADDTVLAELAREVALVHQPSPAPEPVAMIPERYAPPTGLG